MTMDIKVTPCVYDFNKVQNPSSVCIKHVVDLIIRNYRYGQNKMYKSSLCLRDDENNIEEAHFVMYEANDKISLYLQFLPEDQDNISGQLKLSLRYNNGPYALLHEGLMDSSTATTLGWGKNHIISKEAIRTCYNYNGSLVIRCEIYFNLRTNLKPLDTHPLHQTMQLSKDFGSLLSTEELSDVTIKVGDQELKAHKPILSARSPVFNRMFKSDMAESRLNTVEITDVKFEVLQTVLKYIYTDQVDVLDKNVKEMEVDKLGTDAEEKKNEALDKDTEQIEADELGTRAEEILAAADKYQLDDLKAKCGFFLSKNLTVKNVVHRFILADVYHENTLKDHTVMFMKRYRREVMATEEWKAATEKHMQALGAALL